MSLNFILNIFDNSDISDNYHHGYLNLQLENYIVSYRKVRIENSHSIIPNKSIKQRWSSQTDFQKGILLYSLKVFLSIVFGLKRFKPPIFAYFLLGQTLFFCFFSHVNIQNEKQKYLKSHSRGAFFTIEQIHINEAI